MFYIPDITLRQKTRPPFQRIIDRDALWWQIRNMRNDANAPYVTHRGAISQWEAQLYLLRILPCIVVTKQIGNPWRCLECDRGGARYIYTETVLILLQKSTSCLGIALSTSKSSSPNGVKSACLHDLALRTYGCQAITQWTGMCEISHLLPFYSLFIIPYFACFRRRGGTE
jgi:hypothetical protein